MKKHIFLLAVSATLTLTVQARDTYDAANFANTDLNGTARYVGMGGALSALGGDLSVMSSNPAGTGVYRRSEIALSASGLFTGESGQLGHDKGRGSFDQLGIVFSLDMDNRSPRGLQRVNFGVNYHKTRNHFGNLNVNVDNLYDTYSQTFQIAYMAGQAYAENSWGMLADLSAPIFDTNKESATYGKKTGIGIIGDPYECVDEQEGLYDVDNFYGYTGVAAKSAAYQRHQWGSTTQTDFNVSFNVSDQYFFGVSLGVYDVNYSRDAWYKELGTDGNYYDFTNWYDTDGNGFDLKFGAIIRPIQSSPFRIGLAIHTPTWYRLEDTNGATLYYNDQFVGQNASDPYEYDYRTPWKFGISLGHTVGNYFAFGAEYEFSDLGTAHYSVSDMGNSEYFRAINDETKRMLKGQHTLRFGMEVKPADNISIRAGYNYVSSPYENTAYRVLSYDGPFTETDFCNWKAINRFTFGLGFRFGGGYLDLAYQYQSQKGDFYAFDDIDLVPTEVENNRSQLLATLGVRF